MDNIFVGPMLSDSDFYSSLRFDNPKMREVKDAFAMGDTSLAEKLFFEYIRNNLEGTKYFSAIGFDPSNEPDALTRKQAEDALEYNMVACDIYYKFDGDVDWFSNHTYNGYEEWTWQLSRHRQVLDLSWVYYYTKEEKYAERAVELLLSWMNQAIAPPIETDGHTTLCWRTIECGIRMSVWAKSLILLLDSSALSPSFVVNFFKSVYEHAERLYHRYTAANWLTIEMNGLFVLSTLYPFFEKSNVWCEFAKSIFLKQMNEQTLDDGTHYELTFGYQRVSLDGFGNALRLGLAFGQKFPKEYTDKLLSELHALIKVTMPSGDAPFVNDGKLLDVFSYVKKFEEFFPNDPLIKFACSGGVAPLPDFDSLLLKNAGFAVFRSGWDKNSVAGFFDGGKFGRCHNHEDIIRCHQHEDKLNFLMYCGEDNILCEAESYAYDTSKLRYHVLSSAAHNTALVDGKGQARLIKNHWDDSMLSSIEDVEFRACGDIEYARARYDEGYGDNGEISAVHERCVYFVKNPCVGESFFIIKDHLSSDKVRDYDIVWHYKTEKLDVFENKAICNGLATFFAGDPGSITVYCGSEEPFAGWRSNSFIQGDFGPVPTIYYRVAGKCAEVVSAFVPSNNKASGVSSIDYSSGKITVHYTNGENLIIDF